MATAMVNSLAATSPVTASAAAPSQFAAASLRSSSVSFSPSAGSWRFTRSARLVSRRIAVGIRASALDVSKIVPQADRILLRLESPTEQSSGGVLLPRSAVKFARYLVGEVLAIGSEVEKIEKGSKVLVSDINAYEVNLGTPDKICFARADDLLAVVE